MVRQVEEEASLSSDIVWPRIKSVGSVSYFHIRDERAGGETALLQPEVDSLTRLRVSNCLSVDQVK
jgi:hypothetical protein